MAKKGLGRSFDSLIPTDLLDESFDPLAAHVDGASDLRYLKLTEVYADETQPRRHFDESALAELTASIKEHGVLQPIVVTVRAKSGYTIVAGERRYRAATAAGLDKIPAIVRTLSDQHRLELSLIENIQRRDLSAIETAVAYARLRDQFNLTLDEIGARVGNKSVSAVSNTLRLLKLPKIAQQALLEGKLTEGQARPLVGVDEAIVEDVLPQIIKQDWSARMVERYVSQLKQGEKARTTVQKNSTYTEEALRIGERIKAPVDIRVGASGSGRIVISFKNTQELDRIKRVFGE
jgi:ParB family chromosome partitioning protein